MRDGIERLHDLVFALHTGRDDLGILIFWLEVDDRKADQSLAVARCQRNEVWTDSPIALSGLNRTLHVGEAADSDGVGIERRQRNLTRSDQTGCRGRIVKLTQIEDINLTVPVKL